MPNGWQCPYCGHFATLSTNDFKAASHYLFDHSSECEGNLGYQAIAVCCPNGQCRKITLTVILGALTVRAQKWDMVTPIETWRLRPESSAKPQPDYIPQAIRDDYFEACLIRDKSPKASATLSRRCLQGMIRNFWGITKSRLIDEVNALQDRVEPDVWEAIKAVKDIGNIGAHMEKDINVIVEVDPDEAQLLIELIEQLLKEWYVARYQRQERMAAVAKLAADKRASKKGGSSESETGASI